MKHPRELQDRGKGVKKALYTSKGTVNHSASCIRTVVGLLYGGLQIRNLDILEVVCKEVLPNV